MALERGEAGQDTVTSNSPCGVEVSHHWIVQRLELGTLSARLVQDIQQIPRCARQAIKAGDDQQAIALIRQSHVAARMSLFLCSPRPCYSATAP